MITIYKITNPLGKVYIGQTKDFTRRKRDYKNVKKIRFQKKIEASILEYGWVAHTIEAIDSCKTRFEGYDLETLYIAQYDSYIRRSLNDRSE